MARRRSARSPAILMVRTMLSVSGAPSKIVIPTLHELAGRAMSNAEMLAVLREQHPDVSLPEIVRGALYAVSDPTLELQDRITRIYDFALASRRLL